jgi:phosphoribosylpyrophosphate synthetase
MNFLLLHSILRDTKVKKYSQEQLDPVYSTNTVYNRADKKGESR